MWVNLINFVCLLTMPNKKKLYTLILDREVLCKPHARRNTVCVLLYACTRLVFMLVIIYVYFSGYLRPHTILYTLAKHELQNRAAPRRARDIPI